MSKHDTDSESASRSHDSAMSAKKLNAVIGYFTSVLTACAIMMWSVFNTWSNILAYWANDKADQLWWVAGLMIIITCIVPFLLGLVLLYRSMGKTKRS